MLVYREMHRQMDVGIDHILDRLPGKVLLAPEERGVGGRVQH